MGELEGRPPPDRPEDRPSPPPDAHRPRPRVEIRPIATPRPAPGPADVLLTLRDGPNHRPSDVESPTGKELLDEDAPGTGMLDQARRRFLDQETLGNSFDAADGWGSTIEDALPKPQGPTYAYVQSRPSPSMHDTPDYALPFGQTAQAALVGGILVGEGLSWAYRKVNELKEIRHARDR